MFKYELVKHAGEVRYEDWAAAGVRLPIFDKDGTLTAVNDANLLEDVLSALQQHKLGRFFEKIAVVSNNHDVAAVENFGRKLEAELGVGVLAVAKNHGFDSRLNKKPHPAMGLVVAEWAGLEPHQMGVIGDRRYTDVGFGRKLGVARIALCEKMGEGDARWVPTLRRIERVWVAADRALGIAA